MTESSMQESKRRVVVTGLGIVSSIGCSLDDARTALREGRSGIAREPALTEAGMRCDLTAPIHAWNRSRVPKKSRLNMSEAAMYATAAAVDAVADSGLDLGRTDLARVGVVVGTEFGGIGEISRMHRLLSSGKKSRAGAAGVAKLMNSTASANIAVTLGIRGRVLSPSSSFALGTDCIGQGFELIQHGTADCVLCGSTEEPAWMELGPYFENLGLLPVDYDGDPAQACRPYDIDHQGMIMSAGSGILILESMESAITRDAHIYAEIVAYAATNDGEDLFRPSGEGLSCALHSALELARTKGVKHIDYLNTHGTGTPVGDRIEARVLRAVLSGQPLVSSTKAHTGHGLGAAGSIEAVLTLLMLSDGFVAPTLNLHTIDADCRGLNHAREMIDMPITAAASFNVGLGGTNSAIVFRATSGI